MPQLLKYSGPLNNLGLNCTGPLKSRFFFSKCILQYYMNYDWLNPWM